MAVTRPARATLPRTLFIVVLAIMAAMPAIAAEKSKDREMARRVQMLQQEKAELSAKLKEASGKAEELDKAVAESKQGAERSAREAAGTKRLLADMTARFDKLTEDHKALQARLDETSLALSRREKEKQQLEEIASEQIAALGRQSRIIESCRTGNGELYQAGLNLLEQLRAERKRGLVSPLGFAQVDQYKDEQDARDRLDRFRLIDPQ